jgi:flagellar biosynthesis GTPase FlhF
VKRSIYTVSLLGLSLFVGSACTTRKEAARENVREERQEAQEAQKEATQEAREAQNEATQKAREAQNEANEEAREARQAERHAAQVPQDNTLGAGRQPVAGREPIVALEETVRGELGDGWNVTRTTDTVLVTRKVLQAPPRAMTQKVNDQIRSLHDDHKGLTVELPRRGEIKLQGNIAACEDAADVIEDFTKIEGVNQIHAKVSCLSK